MFSHQFIVVSRPSRLPCTKATSALCCSSLVRASSSVFRQSASDRSWSATFELAWSVTEPRCAATAFLTTVVEPTVSPTLLMPLTVTCLAALKASLSATRSKVSTTAVLAPSAAVASRFANSSPNTSRKRLWAMPAVKAEPPASSLGSLPPSYAARFAGSFKIEYASATSLNLAVASSTFPGFLSGWWRSACCLYARRISSAVAVFATPRTA
mmetsp:Transcript_30500/g.70340  ORF Transcript_30500/g.70340 Transcript_30500/m.70340 type:complete len:212 (-) Transcript_30500:67-702(-)